MSVSSQIRGGLRNLENLILSLTLENRLLCKGFSPVEKQLIKIDSQLQGVFLDPREFGFWRPLSVRLSEVRGSNSTTPQGDGNVIFGIAPNHKGFKFHYPARGRKLIKHITRLSNSLGFKFHYPARGRKLCIVNYSRVLCLKFKFHYPARGRKLVKNPTRKRIRKFKFHYPARGRKPNIGRVMQTKMSSNSTTPQGDGNRTVAVSP